MKIPSTALLNVPRTTSPAPWMAVAAAFMGLVVCFVVGIVLAFVFAALVAPVVVVPVPVAEVWAWVLGLVLVFMVAVFFFKFAVVLGYTKFLRPWGLEIEIEV